METNTNACAEKKKVAIVTAAGSGIGAACARELANLGYAVALMSPPGKTEALAKELGGFGLTGSGTVVSTRWLTAPDILSPERS